MIQSVSDTQENIVDLNKVQLFEGLNSRDEVIGEYLGGIYGYKNVDYAFEKYSKNPLPGLGNPDLFDTGSFFAGFTISISGKKMDIFSTDSKNDKLFQKYPAIFGLGPKAQTMYIGKFLQLALNERRIQKLGL